MQKLNNKKKLLSPKRMAVMAMFVALSYVASFIEFPIFGAAEFLKIDFGNVFIMLISFLFGPIEGIIVCLLKEGLRLLTSKSGGVGELANIIMTVSYIIVPGVVYKFRKSYPSVCLSLVVGCISGTLVSLVTNRFITFPLYMKDGAASFFAKNYIYVVAFNVIKTGAISCITLLLYKRLSWFIKKHNI